MRSLLKERAAPAPTRPELLERPRLAPDVRLHEPITEGAPWVVQRGAQQYIRVGGDMVRLLRVLDGAHDHAGLAETLGPPWTAGHVGVAVASLRQKKLLDDGIPRRHSGTWFKFVPPLTFQFTVLRPERLLRRLAGPIGLLAGRSGAVLGLLLAVGGLVALAVQAPAAHRALGEPLPLTVLLALACASVVATALHEMGHGAVLTYHGGRPSRMGVMLFYLTPAFFCDVSDGWRLPHRRQRVQVALAGIVTQTVIAGSAALAAAVVPSPGVRDAALVFAASTYVTSLLNALPFVKLDGYIALMTHLDVPHLRDRTMTDARRFLARLLFGGGAYRRELPRLRWSVPFGLACMAFPLYLVALACALWLDLLQGTGLVGAALVVAGAGWLAYRAWAGGRALVREATAAGARRGRLIAVWLLLAGAAAAAATLVTVPYQVTGGYVREHGRTTLVLSDAADRQALRAGAEVALVRRGMVTRERIGTARVDDAHAVRGTAPLSAFVPVRVGDGVPVPAYRVPVTVRGALPDGTGTAHVAAGTRPLGEWLYLTYLAPAWR
ncbi:daptide biosynthesis intramembrane metalloprotease [Streptomyces sp. NPDC047017]|uniref:daptide biosynthesis intramembrane metalloprotease n=1 Tax=Streptomyces sp. NPDC047017 TaxID=3155024 RepID=UPI0033FF679E